jgi:hypothetical protein
MLTPNNRIVLLPQDREIMDITGMSEKEYRWFVKEALLHSKLRPGEPTMDFGVSLAIAIIGVALSVAGSLLAPKPRQQQQQAREQRQIGGQDFVSGQRFGPTSGFDSVQNVVELGSTIPLVYANRRIASDGNYYGGVRVNTNLLWSQLFSVGGGQLLRGIFLISEGTIGQPDPMQFAIGNNLLSTFDLQESDTSRLSIYFTDGSRSNNRIVDGDFIAGRSPALDLGNLDPTNVFAARASGDSLNSDFVFASTPSNQTTFGVGTFIGNNFPYRPNFDVKPVLNPEAIGKDQNDQAKAQRDKDNRRYSGRAAITGLNGVDVDSTTAGLTELQVGDEIRYSIFTRSDFFGEFEEGEAKEDTKDIAQAVASRQNSYDDAIQVGDRYLAGTAIVVCTDRTPDAFNSEVNFEPVRDAIDNGLPQAVTAFFKVIKPGKLHLYERDSDQTNPGRTDPPTRVNDQINATRRSHLMRVSEGFISTERKTKFVEVGFRSTVNMNFNGICAWRNIPYSYETIDSLNNETPKSSFYTNPTYTSPETRYSFFKVSYKKAMDGPSDNGTIDGFIPVDCIFAVRSLSSSPVFNYLRFEFNGMDPEQLWEIKFTPVSGFEARQFDVASDDDKLPILVLDYKLFNRESASFGDITFRFSGLIFNGADINTDNFGVNILRATLRLGNAPGSDNNALEETDEFDDDERFHADAFARMGESFIFNEITTSANNPEHQIVYVNTQTSNASPPQYSNLALIGLNIRSSTEINQLQQFSVYVEQGIQVEATNGIFESTNRFPDVLFDLLTNQRYGTGSILNSQQIDQASFDAAADFCESRFYFFDGIIDEKLNIRSWAAQTAQAFLLDFVIRNGKFALQPAVNLDGPETIRGLFTAGNIIENTFELSFADEQDRIPPRVQVRWREEKPDQDKGLFPLIRQVTVREAGTPENAPLEQIDASAFATSQRHAIDVAKFICRTKRLVTHSVSFTTTPTENVLDIGSVFKLGLETVNFEQPQNGAITSTGEVTAWPPLADGSYPVLLWDGNSIQETTLTVVNGKAAPANSVFCLRNTTATTQTYKTQSLSFNEDGNIEVQATFFPTNEAGISLIAEGFDSTSVTDWIIEGAI